MTINLGNGIELTDSGQYRCTKCSVVSTETMTKRHPAKDWKFVDEIEEGFVDWFNDLNGGYSLRSEWFYGDCLEGDEKTRQRIMYEWVHSAYVSGYNAAMKPYGGTE